MRYLSFILFIFLSSCFAINNTKEERSVYYEDGGGCYIFDSNYCLSLMGQDENSAGLCDFFYEHEITASKLLDLCSELSLDHCEKPEWLDDSLKSRDYLIDCILDNNLDLKPYNSACIYPMLSIIQPHFIEGESNQKKVIEFKNDRGGTKGRYEIFKITVKFDNEGKLIMIKCELDRIEI